MGFSDDTPGPIQVFQDMGFSDDLQVRFSDGTPGPTGIIQVI
jgi:hypothetical protein